jgi:predicted RNase H-like HicB family nuclease
MGTMKPYRFAIVIEEDADGFFAYCPELQGCYTQGETYDAALSNIRDAIRLHVQDRLESGEPIPAPTTVTLTSLEVAVWARAYHELQLPRWPEH